MWFSLSGQPGLVTHGEKSYLIEKCEHSEPVCFVHSLLKAPVLVRVVMDNM